MTPQEFLRFHVQNITTETELRGKFKLFFPNLEYSEALIPRTNGEERLKIKRVDGLGIFLFYSRRGKRQFHEHLLDIITEELRRQGINYRRSRKNIGADLEIGKLRIELEIRSNPPKEPEKRNDLSSRARKHPEHTIMVLLNQQDKRAYLSSPLREILIQNNRFLTIPEFLQKIRYLQDHIF